LELVRFTVSNYTFHYIYKTSIYSI